MIGSILLSKSQMRGSITLSYLFVKKLETAKLSIA